MLPQFYRDVFDTSRGKIAKIDNLHIPDLPMLHFAQNLTQNKKPSYNGTYHVTPKSFEQFLSYFIKGSKSKSNPINDLWTLHPLFARGGKN